MRKTHRHISAFVLCVIYGLIALSPLAAQMAMRSPVIAHALTGECAGECGLCGCSPERSASHTCCCWQNKLQQEHNYHDGDQDLPDCCKKIHTEQNNNTASINSRPCNSGKTMVLVTAEQSDVLPFSFNQGIFALVETPLGEDKPASLNNWPGDPPDPPPKLS